MLSSEAEFASACQAYLASSYAATHASLGPHSYAQGWRWKEVKRPYRTPVGHLVRTLDLPWPHEAAKEEEAEEFAEEEEDEARSNIRATRTVHVVHSIVYSPTWRVPVLYFHASIQDGPLDRPLELEEMLASPAFVAPPSASAAPDAATFAPLSQTDHPLTGLPCFYLHPCQTSVRMEELLPSSDPACYIATFLSLHAPTLQLRSG